MTSEQLLTVLLEQKGFAVTPEWTIGSGPKYRWDLAVYNNGDKKPFVLVEIHGLIWRKGGHSSGHGIQRDCRKLRRAVRCGYRQFSFTKDEVDRDPDACVNEIVELSII